MVAAAAAAVAVVLASLAGWVLLRRRRRFGGIPRPFPFWSDLLLTVMKTGDFPESVKLHQEHGPVFWWRFLGRPMLMVGSYEAAKKVLHGEHTIVEAEYPPSVKALLGPQGMVNAKGAHHIRIKRLAQAAFTPRAIRGYLPRMQATAEEAVAKWAAQGDILAYDEMKWFTFRVAVDIIVGFDCSWTSPEGFPVVNSLFKDWLDGLFSFPVAIPGTAFARGLKARAGLMQRIHASLDMLEERKRQAGTNSTANSAAAADESNTSSLGAAAGKEGSGGGSGSSAGMPRTDSAHEPNGVDGMRAGKEEWPAAAAAAAQPTALDLLMGARDEHGNGLTREQLADNVLTMLFAGHDTSATTLTRIFQHLDKHPEAAERLRQEQATVLATHGPAITEAALDCMPFTDAVVREAMRVTPIIAGFPRVALQDFELCGYTIPKGTAMQCSLAHPLLTDARWPEDSPLAFRPERWLGGAAHKQGAWIPFGGGSRLCLGWLLAMAEMKVLLAVMFRGHTLQLQRPDEPWSLFPLARPKLGMPARFLPLAVLAE